ncbi:hypothetical protein GGX14DRAFT_563710 [Mycena pura]|uniref:Uncharacterized protein n=1 Tax=Mycena pura TaxID=153505 RepID=A0AAD6VHQ8_9AGAR|nr:hypothetical protein GGX14DRAFT_563710 [Mycena pura]
MAADHTDSPPGYYDEDLTKKVNDPPATGDKAQNSLVSESRYGECWRSSECLVALTRQQYTIGGTVPFVGRIKATAIPPPHTVASLKRALVHAEELPDPTGELTGLFETKDSRTAMLPGSQMFILTGNIGATPETALALVFHAELGTNTSSFEHLSTLMSPPKYLYYRLYMHTCEDTSAHSFAEGEPALGRIDRALIAPPRDVSSIKRRIAKVEGKPIYIFADLHLDTTAKSPQASNAQVADSCGATAHAPILIVQPERRAGLHNRPLLVLSAADAQGWSWIQSRWLSPLVGDILHSDGISHIVKDKAGWSTVVYTAVDTKGRTGWIKTAHTRLLDEPESGSWQCNVQ